MAEAERLRFERQFEYDNTIAHIQGAYFAEAILSTVCNYLSDKHAKKHEYPAKPYDLSPNKNTESENERQLELFKAQLNTTMNNFNRTHGKGTEG